MARINTAVTAVGTVAGGVALGTGIAKANIDAQQHELEERVQKLVAEKSNIPIEKLEIENEQEFRAAIDMAIYAADSDTYADIQKVHELEQKSKTLGDIRTGTVAASTATNIAGTAIAATNQIDEELTEKIHKCIAATQELSNARMAAKVENSATDTELSKAETIITACRDYEYVDLKPINKHAIGAAVSSGIGIGTGTVGTIVSAVANTNKSRNDDENKEKNLNTTANVMSGAATAASVTASIFNAKQISAIKKVASIAAACEGALNQ